MYAIRSYYGMLIDEAHSTFLFGPNGRGVAEHFEVDKEVDFHLGTFSKSLGGQGGFVAGTRELCDYVVAFARSRFFSCNLSPVLVAGLRAGLRIASEEPRITSYNVCYTKLLRHADRQRSGSSFARASAYSDPLPGARTAKP